jgi:hypothetical protein
MPRPALVATVIFVGATFANADTIESCASIENPLARLACFDRIAERASPEPPRTPAWTAVVVADPMTDEISTTLNIESTNADRCGFLEQPARLSLICRSRDWAVRIEQHCSLGLDRQFQFAIRFDRDAARSEIFVNTVRSDIEVAGRDRTNAFVARLIDATRLLVRVEPFNEYPVVFQFPVGGLREAAEASRAPCRFPQ